MPSIFSQCGCPKPFAKPVGSKINAYPDTRTRMMKRVCGATYNNDTQKAWVPDSSDNMRKKMCLRSGMACCIK